MLVLTGEAKSSPARDQDQDAGSSAEQVGHEGGGVDDVFEIVQNEQQVPLAHDSLKSHDQGFIARIAHAENVSDGGRNQIGMSDRREADEADAIREILGKLGGNGKGDLVLPTPPGPVRVSSRTSGWRESSTSAATSRSRPTSGVSGSGSGDGWAARAVLITVAPIVLTMRVSP